MTQTLKSPKPVGLVGSIESGFRNFANFSGRSSRSEFWWWVLFVFVGSLVVQLVDNALGTTAADIFGTANDPIVSSEGGSYHVHFGYSIGTDAGLVQNIFSLAVLIPGVALAARRLHDIGWSGWWQLLPFAVFIAVMAVLFLAGGNSAPDSIQLLGVLAVFATVIAMIVIYSRRSEESDNRFGPASP